VGAVVATTQDVILQAVVDKLLTDLADLGITASQCWISDDPEIENAPIQQNWFLVVSPMAGQFNGSIIDGAGTYGVQEDAGVTVAIFTAIKTDRAGQSAQALLDADRGLLPLKHRILKSLAGKQLYATAAPTVELLINYMAPLHCSNPDRHRCEGAHTGLKRLLLSFSTDFLWDTVDIET
jgi:hypothetical protein